MTSKTYLIEPKLLTPLLLMEALVKLLLFRWWVNDDTGFRLATP